ncbi:MAG: GIY-YIG nuclease family protein [Proteobacteria bacterium]|jgi:putative endonuclease|nr:GIY-YIG nuclease family protein [Pseudomonadota bacterium]MCG6934573.1 GIY-YIG nuclease family protein [Pseudomonadota bacterium]
MLDPKSPSRWFVYMVACRDQSLYTGISVAPEQRVKEHNHSPRGARYTRARRPVTLVYTEAVESRSAALQRESAIKRLSRQAKLALIRKQPR